MSWMAQDPLGEPPVGPPPDPPGSEGAKDKVKDPNIPGRMVSTKQANRPFLAYKEYRDRREAEHKAWEQRMKERDERIAKGLPVGPPEKDPTAEEEVGLLGLLKFLVYCLIFLLLAGKFFTGDYLWEYEGKWTNLKTYWPSNQRLFSEGLLAQFDGTDPNKPLYLAIDHDVYDVSSNRKTYGPGGSYHLMAGVDAARSFATGCFATHRTHDLRGLSERELNGLEHWKQFFANHQSYFKVGKVVHHPIDPASPIPEHCNPKKRNDSSPKKATEENKNAVHAGPDLPANHPSGKSREEL